MIVPAQFCWSVESGSVLHSGIWRFLFLVLPSDFWTAPSPIGFARQDKSPVHRRGVLAARQAAIRRPSKGPCLAGFKSYFREQDLSTSLSMHVWKGIFGRITGKQRDYKGEYCSNHRESLAWVSPVSSAGQKPGGWAEALAPRISGLFRYWGFDILSGVIPERYGD
jgi:hypothetical protein